MPENQQHDEEPRYPSAVETAKERLLMLLRLLAKEVARRLKHQTNAADSSRGPRGN
jgi:hypothetical protein